MKSAKLVIAARILSFLSPFEDAAAAVLLPRPRSLRMSSGIRRGCLFHVSPRAYSTFIATRS
jgi:hypothetical protein